jgi:predicted nucleic acid-binding protein
MALYTFSSSNAIPRLVNQRVVVDTSYLIAFADANDRNYTLIRNFHTQMYSHGVDMCINFVIRQEFLKHSRKTLFIENILNRVQANPLTDALYKSSLKQTKFFTQESLKHRYEEIYKFHLKNNTIASFIGTMTKNISDEVQQLEVAQKLNYFEEASPYSWLFVNNLIDTMGLAPVDAMIVNFAMATGAAAIFSTDCDFAVVADVLDVYVPLEVAQQCAIYDPAID